MMMLGKTCSNSSSRPHPHIYNLSRGTQLNERMEAYPGVDDIFHRRSPREDSVCLGDTGQGQGRIPKEQS